MGLVYTIVIGFIVGMIAKFLVPGKDGGGFIRTTLLGIGGSFLGSFLSGLLGGRGRVGLIGSVVGAVVILLIFRFFNGRQSASS